MRVAEIVAAVIVGALLIGVGFELGRSNPGPEDEKARRQSEQQRQAELEAMVDKAVEERMKEYTEAMARQVEELISGRPQRVLPELPQDTNAGEGRAAQVGQMEGELDAIISRGMAEADKAPGRQKATTPESDTNRRREPFDPATLREFEEARKRMLEERRRKQEKEDSRKNK